MDKNERSRGAAFVVGGSGGLGRAVCHALAQQFEGVFFTYRSNLRAAESLREELAPMCKVGFAPADTSDSASVDAAVDAARRQFGTIPAVVMASGVNIEQPYVSRIKEAQWLEVIEVELMGFIRVVAATLPILRAQGNGAYVALTSVATASYPPGDALSAVPKAGMEMLARAIAKEEGRAGIRANCVAPGLMDAGLGAEFLKRLYTPEIWETQRKKIALKRFGTAEDVSDVVAFLVSDKARYVTGQIIYADGGFHL
jgi:NAD(P)-dependent dehydrogenase (short-subunit alcohol dehydrogenase family)